MGSAAPSAGVGAGEASPVPQSAPAETGEQEAGQGKQEPNAGTRADGHSIRPIKESLPGVIEATEDDERLAELTGERSRLRHKTESGVARDDKGRFVKADGSISETDPDAPVPPKPGEEPAKPKYKFAGEEWESAEKAEQSFRTLRGQYKAHEAKARQFDGAAASARGWYAEAQRLQAELATLRGGNGAQGTATPATPESGEEAQPAGESIDWAMFAEVQKAAAEQGNPNLATVWLAKEQERVIQARIDKILEERLAPVREAEENAFLESHTTALFESIASYVNEDGSPAFPELLDEAEAAEVGRLWRSRGYDPEHALTLQGAVDALMLYRGTKAGRSAPASTPAPQAPKPAHVPTDASAVLEHGQDAHDDVAQVTGQSSLEAQRIVAAMRKSGAHLLTPELGFSR